MAGACSAAIWWITTTAFWGARMFGLTKKIFGTAQSRLLSKYRRIVTAVNRHDERLQNFTDEQLRGQTAALKERLAAGESLDALLPEAYALVKQACRRLCGT